MLLKSEQIASLWYLFFCFFLLQQSRLPSSSIITSSTIHLLLPLFLQQYLFRLNILCEVLAPTTNDPSTVDYWVKGLKKVLDTSKGRSSPVPVPRERASMPVVGFSSFVSFVSSSVVSSSSSRIERQRKFESKRFDAKSWLS